VILLIDNYDSFTYNISHALGALGADVQVLRNDAVTVEQGEALAPSHVVLSPGPGRPESAGLSVSLLERLGSLVPVLGVCLGHQCIASAFGARVGAARSLVHGKASRIYHDGSGVFSGLPSPVEATRYHSLAVDEATLPDCLEVTAQTTDGEIMGLRHRELPVEGVQFHPESVLTRHGERMFRNFLNYRSERSDP